MDWSGREVLVTGAGGFVESVARQAEAADEGDDKEILERLRALGYID